MLTPVVFAAPGVMTIMLVPRLLICASILPLAPCPMATMTMTAPTPMMMPSMVSRVRILFLRMLFPAMLMSLLAFMLPRHRELVAFCKVSRGIVTVEYRHVAADHAVAHLDDALHVLCNIRLVRHHHDGDALVVQLLEQRHDL